MTKTANKFNSLAQIAFVEDINQETAADYSGGANIILFEDGDLRGQGLAVDAVPYARIGYVGDYWNDKFSSVQINEGIWEFYADANLGGGAVYLGPGRHNFHSSFNDKVSSLRRV
jgi:Beta/Gamma crystallin